MNSRVRHRSGFTVKSMKALEERGFQAGLDELRAEPGVFFRRGEGDNDDFPFVNIRGVIGSPH